MIKKLLLFLIAASLTVGGCNKSKKSEASKELERQEYSDDAVEVVTMELRSLPFKRQLATNGRLRAKVKSVMSFKTSGVIEKIYVSNGARVRAGDILAELDRTEAQNSLTSAMQNFEKAKIDLNDQIIGFGYESLDDNIPERTLELAKIRSGYNVSEISLKNARNNFDAGILRAPFAGKVASVTGNQHERVGNELCTIVDDSQMIVQFSILETELDFVKPGNAVKVASFFEPNNFIMGRITNINPLVDKNGQVLVEGEIANNGTFIDGMNVKIFVEKEVPGQLVVPKSAVVIRDNLEVLFRYRDGKAQWTYVHTLMDNNLEYVVAANTSRGADLSVGDMIIISGNMNIADGTPVAVKQ